LVNNTGYRLLELVIAYRTLGTALSVR